MLAMLMAEQDNDRLKAQFHETPVRPYFGLEEGGGSHNYTSAVLEMVWRYSLGGGNFIHHDDERLPLEPGETPQHLSVRFRTLGCYPLTGALESEAACLEDIIDELLATRVSERQGRAIDRDSSGSMEKKKQEGYF